MDPALEAPNPLFSRKSVVVTVEDREAFPLSKPSRSTLPYVPDAATINALLAAAAPKAQMQASQMQDLPTTARVNAEDVPYPIHRQSRRLSIKDLPANTTLKVADWEMIEDDLLPFELTAIFISLGGVALIGLTIHALTANPILVSVGTEFLNGMGYGDVLLFFFVIPCVIGTVQILLAIFFSMLAALESWKHVSIQDVIRHHLPDRMESCAKRVPLTCTARKAYLLLMWIFLSIQIVAAAVAFGLNARINQETNKGAEAAGSGDIVRYVLDYSAAVFNECCANNGWSKQGVIPKCLPDTSELKTCSVPPDRELLQDKLCACYLTDDATYQRYMAYANSSRVCEFMSKATLPIVNGQKIPGTSISMRSIVPPGVNMIPIVGDMNLVFGCGTGYLRGYQWALVEWSTENLNPYFVAILVISGIQILFLVFGASIVCRIRITQEGGELGADGNVEYGVAQPIKLPMGIRGLFSKENSPHTNILSPKLLLPRFRSRSNSNGPRTPKMGKSSPSAFNLSSPATAAGESRDLVASMNGGLTSPDMMKTAAKRTSTLKVENNALSTATAPPVDSIDGVI